MKRGDRARKRHWVASAAALAVTAGMLWAAIGAHLRRACMELDTPHLLVCAPSGTQDQARAELRTYIGRNPGDAPAWTRLLLAESAFPSDAVLHGAAALAPNEPNVARWRAAHAFERGRMSEGVSILVDLLHHRASPEAAAVLAQLASTPEGLHLLWPHLGTDTSRWLPALLAAVRSAHMPPGQLLPLVMEAQHRGVLTDQSRRYYIRWLKTTGHLAGAHALWLASRGDRTPPLYNGGFDERFEPDGFDWELNAQPRNRAGVLAEQTAMVGRGLVLSLAFTGRSFTPPLLRQNVFAAPGVYRFQGEYVASKFRSEAGLVWSVRCAADNQFLARSLPLRDTGGLWKPVDLEFALPPECGPAMTIQLEPSAGYEAAAGMRGQITLDAFELARGE